MNARLFAEIGYIPARMADPLQWAECLAVLRRADKALESSKDGEREELVHYVEALRGSGFHTQVLLLSFLFGFTRDPVWARRLLDAVEFVHLPLAVAKFLYWQLDATAFRFPGVYDDAARVRIAGFYQRVVQVARAILPDHRRWIPPEARTAGNIVVTAVQMIGVAHAPTHQVLENCRTLQRYFWKRVLLVNTAEIPQAMPIPFYNAFAANSEPGLAGHTSIRYRDEVLAFRQFDGGMNTADEVAAYVDLVAAWNPSFILTLGGPSVAADFCADFTTVATMPMACELPVSRGTLYLVPGAPNQRARWFQNALGIADERVIFTPFAYDLPARSRSLTRAAMGIPDDAFAIAVVGNRLDDDVSANFVEALAGMLGRVPRTFAVFIGEFPRYSEIAGTNRVIRERSCTAGFQKDLLAVYEVCDAFLNPPRLGGGSSAAFALAMGLPVLTLAGGDVSGVVCDEFRFASYEAMREELRRYVADAAFRQQRKGLARSRFRELSDRTAAVGHLLNEIGARLSLRPYVSAGRGTGVEQEIQNRNL